MVMSAIVTVFWNRHPKFKKIQINGKPSPCVTICVLVSIQNNKLGIRILFLRSVLRNELSSTKIHSFEAKWRMLLPHSLHSLFKCSHIGHKRSSWNHEQCCRIKFSFSFHKKIIFHFPNAKSGFFCEAPTKTMLQNWTNIFSKNTRPHYIYKYPNVISQSVSIHLSWKRQISADSVGNG